LRLPFRRLRRLDPVGQSGDAMSDRSGVQTACPYCGVGCGVIATPLADGTVGIKGDPDHPANFGRLCSKGAALGETLALDGRLLFPLVDGTRTDWPVALDLIADRFGRTIAEHGPDSVAIYGSGQLLTEDYYVANKLMKGFIGAANLDTNSRLCMASSVAGHRRAFGSDTVPGTYEDLELADLVVLVGSNLAWCHPVLYQRLAAARAVRGTKVVVIDPRRTATCDIADLHLAITPGTDVALFNGLLTNLTGANAIDQDYVRAHTNGARDAMAAARGLSFARVAEVTGLSRVALHEFYDLFTRTQRVVTVYSQGVNQSTSGTDKVNAVLNCHLITGRIGKPGAGPFSVTGQPNAMGGREVGGLANMLAAHMDIENAEHRDRVQRFWNSASVASKPGYKAVDLFRAVGDGRIKALWILSTNPVDSLPEADSVRAALERCPFVVVSEAIRHTDTARHAHVLLPSIAWGEKSGTVTNSERRISRQRAFLPAPGEAKADWWQICEVAKRLGFAEAFTYAGPHEIFAEHARLSGFENEGSRDFDIGRLGTISKATYDKLAPVRWPQPATGAPTARFFADGKFYTPTGRANFVATPFRPPVGKVDGSYPLLLNTGRIRDQWHTMTRTGKAARLLTHMAEPFVDVHPDDARQVGLAAAHLAEVKSAHGRCIVRVQISERAARGHVFMPIHWTDQFASSGRVDALIAAEVDPISGQPALKHTAVSVLPHAAERYGFAVLREKPDAAVLAPFDYWALAPAAGGWRLEFAGTAQATQKFLPRNGAADVVTYRDVRTQQIRAVAFDGDDLEAAVFVAPAPVAVARELVVAALSAKFNDTGDRLRLLAGRAGIDRPDTGPTVCACFSVGRNTILAAIAAGADTADAIGKATSAGTNCGSCRAELGGLIHATRHQKAG
jgi:assimilatory nitrate reductase catalytic subunit